LALAVFAEHVPSPQGNHRLTGGRTAVEGFFVLSGYLMALISNQNKYKTNADFLKSRILRIYPIYWAVLALTVTASLFIPEFGKPNLESALEFSAFNFFLIGLDVIIILALTGGLTSVSNIVVPQSWSLSLELYFYMVVPFLNKLKTRNLALLCLTILSCKFWLFLTIGLRDPWSYRFFPLEIGFFLWGMLMYRLQWKLPKYSEVVFLVIWLFGNIYRLNPPLEAQNWKSMIFPILLGMTLINFASWDRFKLVKVLGKISYPFYLIHILVSTVTCIGLARLNLSHSIGNWPTYLLILSLTFGLSYLLIKLIEDPIDEIRKRFSSDF
jgi:peptidoglycan/LPS O-acetylase OafA/YrhL